MKHTISDFVDKSGRCSVEACNEEGKSDAYGGLLQRGIEDRKDCRMCATGCYLSALDMTALAFATAFHMSRDVQQDHRQ